MMLLLKEESYHFLSPADSRQKRSAEVDAFRILRGVGGI